MMTRANKIELIKKLSAGEAHSAAEGRLGMIFQRIGLNQYQQEGKEQVYTLEQIESFNIPFNLHNGETAAWTEVKSYEQSNRKEVQIGLPLVVQVNIFENEESEPVTVILPSIQFFDKGSAQVIPSL